MSVLWFTCIVFELAVFTAMAAAQVTEPEVSPPPPGLEGPNQTNRAEPVSTLVDSAPQSFFSGPARRVRVVWHNASDQPAKFDAYLRLLQASSATAVPVRTEFWKSIQILAGQTLLETAPVDLPLVKAQTRFILQLLTGTNHIVGRTELVVYPPDLLKELKPLAGETTVGVFDPQNLLKPLLKAVQVEFCDLEDSGFAGFDGRLALIGPFASRTDVRDGLAGQLKSAAAKGAAIVWLQPPDIRGSQLKPSFYTVPQGDGRIVVADHALVANLAENPGAQMNLIRLARLALRSEPLSLPSEP